jgi:2-polyprenyl-3-methyl-5-hydroxy-6-metoxy-1,4-benzoquinol methylase
MSVTDRSTLSRHRRVPDTPLPAESLPAGIDPGSPMMRGPATNQITLADGSVCRIDGLSQGELATLQWQQEREFAQQILATRKGSVERSRVTCAAYRLATSILARRQGSEDRPLMMGMHPRQAKLVLDLLLRQQQQGQSARFFEIGYGSGTLLKIVADAGFPMAGIEIAATLRQQAIEQVGPRHADRLHLGDFLACNAALADGPWNIVYWNDVFEHIPPDEIADWLKRIHEMLAPGGQLVTITPNWHCRPSDITAAVRPPRTAAEGLHLREYTLAEVHDLLRRAGFARVAMPLLVLPRRIVMCGRGLIGLKRRLEPGLEWLPFRLARLLCRGFALTCTVATKDASAAKPSAAPRPLVGRPSKRFFRRTPSPASKEFRPQ